MEKFADATKEGYIFSGWTDEDKNPITGISTTDFGDKTLYANWEKEAAKHSITYHLNGGENNTNNPDEFSEDKETILYDPSLKGNKFEGWFLEETFDTQIKNISVGTDHDIEVYAKWAPANYEIHYKKKKEIKESNNFEVNPSTYTYGEETIISSDVARPGYRLEGWYLDCGKKGKHPFSGVITAGTTGTVNLCAKWAKVEGYNIDYKLNGGENSKSNPSTYKYGVGIESFAPATRKGYDFVNWTDEKGAEVKSISDKNWGDKTLVANWFFKPVLVKNSDTIFVGEKNINFAMTMDARDEVEFYLNEELISAEDFLNSYTDKDGLVHFTVKPEFVEKLAAGEYNIVAKLASGYTLEYNLAVKELPKTVVTTTLAPDTGITTKEEFSAASNLSILVTVAAVVSLLGIALRKSNY